MSVLRLLLPTLVNLFVLFSIAATVTESSANGSISQGQVKNGRISEQKCRDYKEVYRVIYHSSFPYPNNKPIVGPLKCPTFHVPTIVGGVNALPNEFPHMVSLMYRQRHELPVAHGCGGTLISEKFVLTAAHCINTESGPPIRVLLGELSLKPPAKITKSKSFKSQRFGSRTSRKEVFVEKTYVHPKYNPEISAYHDIALIKLSEKLKFERSFRPKIRPACLAQPNQFDLREVIASGWGKLGSNHDDVHNILQKVKLTVVPASTCGASYRSTHSNARLKIPNAITSDQICAGDKGRDTCSGDSGGPIQLSNKTDLPCMQYVVGITSLGTDHCGSGMPAVYTRVDKYLDWIESIVWKQ